jgi:hypothetical protein
VLLRARRERPRGCCDGRGNLEEFRRRHACCGAVSNGCCVSAPKRMVFEVSAAPLPLAYGLR